MRQITMSDETYEWLQMKVAAMHEAREAEDYEAADEDAYDVACTLGDLMDEPIPNHIAVPCAFGTLIAEFQGDRGIYDGIEIDLVRASDGGTMQVCLAETCRDGREPELNVYVWDGDFEDYAIMKKFNHEGEQVYF